MNKLNRLLKTYDNFKLLTIICTTIYVILFFVLLLLSTSYPILTFLLIVAVAPGCWLLVFLLFKAYENLTNNINKQLTKIIKRELQKEFGKQKIICVFDVKPKSFNPENIADQFHFYYSGVPLDRPLLVSISNVTQRINGDLYNNIHNIDILPEESPTLQSDIVV